MTTTAFVRRATYWVVLGAAAYTVLDWFSPRSSREPSVMLWMGMSIFAADTVGGSWSRGKTVIAALATGIVYVAIVLALQALTATVGGAGVWRPELAQLTVIIVIIAVAVYLSAWSAQRRAQAEARAQESSSSAARAG